MYNVLNISKSTESCNHHRGKEVGEHYQHPEPRSASSIFTPFWNTTIIMNSNIIKIESYGMIMFLCLANLIQYHTYDNHLACCV